VGNRGWARWGRSVRADARCIYETGALVGASVRSGDFGVRLCVGRAGECAGGGDRAPGSLPKRSSDWQTPSGGCGAACVRACVCCDCLLVVDGPGLVVRSLANKLFIDGADQERKLLLNLAENPDSCKTESQPQGPD
jgi:hypothetical protein